MLATVAVSPSSRGHKEPQATTSPASKEPRTGLSVISPLRPSCVESAPTPVSLTLSLQASEGATPEHASSLIPTPSPLTISARDHKPGSSSFTKLANNEDDVRSTLFLDQSSSTAATQFARVRVPVSRLREVPPPLTRPSPTSSPQPQPPGTNHALYTSSSKIQETNRDTEKSQTHSNSYTAVPPGVLLQQGELTNLRGSYGAVEPHSSSEISEACVVNAMPTTTTEPIKRGQEQGVVADVSVSTAQRKKASDQRNHDKEMHFKRSQEDVSEYHSTTRKEELHKGIDDSLPKVTRRNKPACLLKPRKACVTTDQDGMHEARTQAALHGCSVVSTSPQRLNTMNHPSHTPTLAKDLPQRLPGQTEPSDLSKRVERLEDLQHLLTTKLLKEQKVSCTGDSTRAQTLESTTQTIKPQTDQVFVQTDRVGDASATGLISHGVAPTSQLQKNSENEQPTPAAAEEWNVAGDLLMRATQVLSAVQRSCDNMELEDGHFNSELCCNEYSALVNDLTSPAPLEPMVSEQVIGETAQRRSRERTTRHRQTTATNQIKAKKGGSIRIGSSAKNSVQTNRLASCFTPPTHCPIPDLIPPPLFPSQLLYHYLVGGQTATAPPPSCVQETQPCEQQPRRVEPLKHTIDQSIQTTADQCVQTSTDQCIQTSSDSAEQGIQTMLPATQEAATSFDSMMLISSQNEQVSVERSFAMAEVVEGTSSPPPAVQLPRQTEEKDCSDLSSEADLAMLNEQPLAMTHPSSDSRITSQQIASRLRPLPLPLLGSRPLSHLLPSTTQEWVQKELVAQGLTQSNRGSREKEEEDHSETMSDTCSTCSITDNHGSIEHAKAVTTEELVKQALVQQAIAILQQSIREEEEEHNNEEHASSYTQTFEADSSSLSSLSTPRPTPPSSPTPVLEQEEELLTPVPSPPLSPRVPRQLSPAEISTPQLSEQTPSPVHLASSLPESSSILSSPPHFSPTPSPASRSLVTLEGTPVDSIVTDKEQQLTPEQQPVHTHEPVLSETPSSSTTSPPSSQLTSSASSDQEISLGQWLPSRRPRECEAQSLSEGELPLSPGDARWKLNKEDVPRSKKQACSLKAERRAAAISFNPKSVQMMSSISSANNVGTSFMGVSEGEVKRPTAKNFAARPHPKSVPRHPHTTALGGDISSEGPGDEDDDTFAGVPSISDSLTSQPANKKHKRRSLPVTHQLSPGEVRKPFIHQLNQTEASNASYSMPYSEGEVPRAVKSGRITAHQTTNVPQRVLHTDHRLGSTSPKPAKDHVNELRDGIDVINVSPMVSQNRNRSRVSSPASSSSRSPSLVVSTSPPQRTHSLSPRLIRVSAARPSSTQQEPVPRPPLYTKATAKASSSDHILPRIVKVSPSAQQPKPIAHSVAHGSINLPLSEQPLPLRTDLQSLDQDKDKQQEELGNQTDHSLLTYSTDFSEDSITSF